MDGYSIEFNSALLVLSISYFHSSWSRKLIERASKTQYVDLPSVNPSELRERGIVIRCANFSVDALRSEESEKSRSHGKSGHKLPIITSDKKTFNIPDDVYNPAFQISMTLYHYPDKCGTKFLREFMTGNSLRLCLCVCAFLPCQAKVNYRIAGNIGGN